MEKTSATEEQARRAAGVFLNSLFTNAQTLIAADSGNRSPTVAILRTAVSAGPRPNSQYIVEKYPDRSYNIKCSVSGWTVPAICKAVEELLQQAPVIKAVDECGRPVDIADPAQRKNVDQIQAQFPNGSSIYWGSAKSQFNIHCPTRAVFDQLASHFASRSTGHEI